MDKQSEQSPWLSIWVHPRETIRRIILGNPNRYLWVLATIYGFSAILNLFQRFSVGTAIGVVPIFLIALIFAPIFGYINFAVTSFVTLWTGKLLKGQASFQQIRAAYAWSLVPYIGVSVFWIFMIAFFGVYIFLSPPVVVQNFVFLFLFLSIAIVVLYVWSVVIYVNTLSEVQGFSILRAIGNILLSGLVLFLLFALIWWIMAAFMGHSHQSGMQMSSSAVEMIHNLMRFDRLPL